MKAAFVLIACSCSCAPLFAQSTAFVGALGGVSTLSADARSVASAGQLAVSLYKPENGPALNLLAGIHLSDYLSLQGNYIWNRNDLRLTSSVASQSGLAFYEQPRESAQHSVVADVLLYFRNRRSAVRPYLSIGMGAVHLRSAAGRLTSSHGSLAPPPATFTSTSPGLRVAVGIDLALGRDWSFRYSFSEAIRNNPLSSRLMPPGQRGLANFQNLFGIVKSL